MLLSINYSHPAAALLSQGSIQIDRFKCPDWPDMIEEASHLCQVAVHTNLKAGRGNLGEKNWDRITRLLELTRTPYLNLHLETRTSDFPDVPLDTTDPLHIDQIIERMMLDVSIASRRFGREKVIVENVAYFGLDGKVLRTSVEPRVIRQVLDETGCGLLLDLSHARIASYHLKMDERAYISELPVERMRELHFTGVHNLNGSLRDHLDALEEDWGLLEWVLGKIRSKKWPKPWLLAFEYGGVGEKFALRSDPQVIARQTPRLYTMVTPI
jgi:uncharacterized protein (UPF0276 family)